MTESELIALKESVDTLIDENERLRKKIDILMAEKEPRPNTPYMPDTPDFGDWPTYPYQVGDWPPLHQYWPYPSVPVWYCPFPGYWYNQVWCNSNTKKD